MKMIQTSAQAHALLDEQSTEFARVENPPGIFPSHEVVPLAPYFTSISGAPAALFLDMDGTITCTEPLFLHGVEQVVRRATGWATRKDWPGLDPAVDHPRIVGYSTVRNLEYLHSKFGASVIPEKFFNAVDSALVFLGGHPIPHDIEVRIDDMMAAYHLEAWWDDAQLAHRVESDGAHIRSDFLARFDSIDVTMFAQMGLMVFYADYLDALMKVNRGEGASVSHAVYGDPHIPAVAPMPGIALLCAVAKGWLRSEDGPALAAAHGHEGVQRLGPCLECFSGHPARVALVTSSGSHETELVLEAVFRAMAEEVGEWGLAQDVTERIQRGFDDPKNYFDTIVTCDDVIEGRTKPFRDPYTLALDRLGLHGEPARRVVGFEDTEAGIIAQRGAGVGVPCALPIEHTQHQDFSAAAHVLPGGVLDALFVHGLFIDGHTGERKA